jgi:methylenetetrahydrofolate reductase (NADPH)
MTRAGYPLRLVSYPSSADKPIHGLNCKSKMGISLMPAEAKDIRLLSRAVVDGYSLEMTTKDLTNLEAACTFIPPGTSISVTFLPGDDANSCVKAAVAAGRCGLSPIPHISARRLTSVLELEELLDHLSSEAKIERAFVIAGDLRQPLGPYEDALAIIKSGLLAKYGVKKVGIAGHPEGHPDISESKLQRALEDKVRLLTELGHDVEIVTQFAFDPEPVINWISKIRAARIGVPVRVGIPGPASIQTLLRFAARCGVGASTKVMAKYGVSITKLLNTAGPEILIQDLAAGIDPNIHGQVKLHFYPFGGLKKTAEWVSHHQSDLDS